MATKLNETTELAIPIKNIIGLVIGTAVAVWAYFGVVERIAVLELKDGLNKTKIDYTYEWVNNFKPPEAVADSVKRVRELELKVKELEVKLSTIER